jgi:hypothetical protein
MRRALLLLVAAAALAGCGGSAKPSGPDPSSATAATVGERTARFTLLVGARVGTREIQSSETGQISFGTRRAHIYKLLPGGAIPQEVVVVGPWTYTNGNVDRAMNDRNVRPWTKLDTRRLSARERSQHPDELAHIGVLVRLPDGVRRAARIGELEVAGERVTQYNGEVDPARVVAATPSNARAGVRSALANDYPAEPFLASYWLDDASRVRRVLVTYTTPKGTRISIDGRFSAFGTAIDTKLPPAGSIQDITP